jgi:hypothetical protein
LSLKIFYDLKRISKELIDLLKNIEKKNYFLLNIRKKKLRFKVEIHKFKKSLNKIDLSKRIIFYFLFKY